MTTVDETLEVPRAFTRDEIVELLRQVSTVASIELKVTVPAQQRGALAKLDIDVLDGKIREVYFFDTPDLTLFKHGVVARGRRTQGAADDTVVKLRPADPRVLPPDVQKSPNLKTEMDVVRGSYVISASLKGQRPVGAVRDAVSGKRPLEKLFSKEQRAFFAAHAPGGVTWSDLTPLGPSYVVVLKCNPATLGRRLTIEQWHYPGEIPLVELSTKGGPKDILQVWADSVTFLEKHGLSATGTQEPKTRKALEFFTRAPARTEA